MLYETSNTAHAAAGPGRTQAGKPPCVQVQVQVSVPTSARQLLRTGETVRSVTVTKPLEALQADVLQQVQSAAAHSPHLGSRQHLPPNAHPGTPTPHTRTAFSRGAPSAQPVSRSAAAGPLAPVQAPQARLVSPPVSAPSSPRAPPSRSTSLQLAVQHHPPSQTLDPPSAAPSALLPLVGGATAPAAGPAEAAAAHCDTESLPPMTRSYLASLRSLEPAHAPGDPRPSQHAAEAYLLQFAASVSMSGCSDCPRLGADVLARCASQRHGMQ